ncbi:hypothetical protein [Glaciecola sp. 1036]|uniref:hypothetical protein n=1 Tax=Alteromonadaceae TaxID=72275 RepID=UPI003CFCB65B
MLALPVNNLLNDDPIVLQNPSHNNVEEVHPTFGPEFIAQKQRIREMLVRFVSENDPIRQALLEIYVSVSLNTPHNDFDNH